MKRKSLKKFIFEFLSIFVAVTSAFALNNWSENKRDKTTEAKILTEIANGLKKDIVDVKQNDDGHKQGIRACIYWRDIINNITVSQDSLSQHYMNLTRDFVSIQNVSGYETLKSKGLELIQDDSLRFEIISLYEYDYKILQKLEEEYSEMQFQENYFNDFNGLIAPNFSFSSKGNIQSIQTPIALNEQDKKLLLSYLWKIENNRKFILYFYGSIAQRIDQLHQRIDKVLNNNE